jgi:hypothetical protein
LLSPLAARKKKKLRHRLLLLLLLLRYKLSQHPSRLLLALLLLLLLRQRKLLLLLPSINQYAFIAQRKWLAGNCEPFFYIKNSPEDYSWKEHSQLSSLTLSSAT